MQSPDVALGQGPASTSTLAARVAAVRRRFKPMLWTFLLIFAIAVAVALLWAPTFRSTSTILIEQQEIPSEFVRSAVTSYADQRVQVISQRVMTSANLISIMDKYNLYPQDRDTAAREALVDRMRDDIDLKMISADVVDPTQGRATKATIAFSVSYDNRNPQVAAKVANELTTLYLSENVESRKQLAADTAGFLGGETERLGKRVSEIANNLATFKAQHSAELPEYAALNLQSLDRANSELRELMSRQSTIDQQLVYLDAQLAQLNPSAGAMTESGERVLSPTDRLKVLQGQYAAALSRYNPDHPDVIRLKREMDGIRAQLGGNAVPAQQPGLADDLRTQLADAQSKLAAARQRYGDEHPDVVALQRQVTSLQTALSQAQAAPTYSAPRIDQNADNPAYIQLRTQRTALSNERASLSAQIPEVKAQIFSLQRSRTVAPEVEKQFNALNRELEGEQIKYNEVRQKQLEAQLAQNLETERKGERFTLIEPALVPAKPVKPNRPAIVMIGFVFAGACAIGLMFLLEMFDANVHGRQHVIELLTVPPLAVIPAIVLDEEVSARRRRRILSAVVTVGAIAAVVVAVHLFVRPLDDIWGALLRRMGA